MAFSSWACRPRAAEVDLDLQPAVERVLDRAFLLATEEETSVIARTQALAALLAETVADPPPADSAYADCMWVSADTYAPAAVQHNMGRLGEEAVPELRRAWNRAASAEERQWLAIALGRLGDASGAEQLRAALGSAEPFVRMLAADAAGLSGNRSLIPFLSPLLDDPFQAPDCAQDIYLAGSQPPPEIPGPVGRAAATALQRLGVELERLATGRLVVVPTTE